MAYTKQNFVDGNVLEAEHLNEIENAVVQNETDIQEAKKDIQELQEPLDPELKLLVLGDSIFAKEDLGTAFINGLGCKTENYAVSGATFAKITDVETTTGTYNCISRQFQRFKAAVEAEKNAGIKSGEGTLKFHEPDAILLDGSVNDYIWSSVMGAMKQYPGHVQKGYTYDETTIMGAMEKLFIDIIETYPKAQRFFVTTHKVWFNDRHTIQYGCRKYMPIINSYIRAPYTNPDTSKTTYEIAFNQDEMPLSSTTEVKAATKVYVRKYNRPDGEKVTYTYVEIPKSTIYSSNALIESAIQGHFSFDALYENLMNVCKRYSFKVIDIYNDSCISAVPTQQVTPTAKNGYWYVGDYNTGVSSSIALHSKANPITISDLRFFDWKGLHPTTFGYEVGYAPLVKAALKLATRKSDTT